MVKPAALAGALTEAGKPPVASGAFDFTCARLTHPLGIELMGHSENDHTRYSAALISSTNGGLGLPRGRSYDGELHLSQAFLVPRLGLQRIGAYGAVGLRPTYFLTSAGEPIAGSGRGNRSFYRVGVYGNLYVGKFDLTGVYQRAGDNVHFGNGLLSALDTLPVC